MLIRPWGPKHVSGAEILGEGTERDARLMHDETGWGVGPLVETCQARSDAHLLDQPARHPSKVVERGVAIGQGIDE